MAGIVKSGPGRVIFGSATLSDTPFFAHKKNVMFAL